MAPTEDNEDSWKLDKQLLIGGLNVDSLKHESELIKSLILSYQFDIFVITEAQLTAESIKSVKEIGKTGTAARTGHEEKTKDDYQLEGYNLYRFDRPVTKAEEYGKGGDESNDKAQVDSEGVDIVKAPIEEVSEGEDILDDEAGKDNEKNYEHPAGGILIYYRVILGEPTSKLHHEPESDIQILWLPFSIVHLIAVYHPLKAIGAAGQSLDQLLYEHVFRNINKSDKRRVVLVGDFNLNPLVERHSEIIKSIKVLGEMEQIIKANTCVQLTDYDLPGECEAVDVISHTCIDHIYVSSIHYKKDPIISSGVKRFGMSDHDITYCNIRVPKFNTTRAHHEKSVAVKEMEDVKESFIVGYESCKKLDTHKRQEILDAWNIIRERNESYKNFNLSATRMAKMKCHKERDPGFFDELHRVGEESFCAPCNIRK